MNATGKTLEALAMANNDVEFKSMIIVGESNPRKKELQSLTDTLPINATIISDAKNMRDLMSEADIAISAGGTTCWELAYMGVPMLCIPTADNQRDIVTVLEKNGAAQSIGWHINVTPEDIAAAVRMLSADLVSRTSMSEKGPQMVDGKGTKRILETLSGAL